MDERFISERLLEEMPRPLINFIWYLWEIYCDSTANESQFILKSDGNSQSVTIPHIDKTIQQYFGAAIDATIIIRKNDTKFYMSRQ